MDDKQLTEEEILVQLEKLGAVHVHDDEEEEHEEKYEEEEEIDTIDDIKKDNEGSNDDDDDDDDDDEEEVESDEVKEKKRLAKQKIDEGTMDFKSNNFEVALKLYNEAFEIFESIPPQFQDSSYQMALYNNRSAVYEKLKQFDSCLQDCLMVLSFEPQHTKVRNRRARVYQQLGQLKESLTELCTVWRINLVNQQQLEPSPIFEIIVQELASQLLNELRGKKEKIIPGTYSKRKSLITFVSVQKLIEAVKKMDEDKLDLSLKEETVSYEKAFSHFYKGLILSTRNLFDQARLELESAAKICDDLEKSSEEKKEESTQSKNETSQQNLAIIWSLVGLFRCFDGQYESCFDAFEKSCSLDPENLDTLTKYAICAIETDEIKAREIFDRAEQINPKTFDFYYHRAQYHYFLKKFDLAERDANQAVQLDSPNTAAQFLIKQIVLETQNEEKIRDIVTEIMAETNDLDVLSLRAQIMLSFGQVEECMKIADEIQLLEPDNPTSYMIKGQCLSQLQRLDEALQTFEEASKLELNSEILLSISQIKILKAQTIEEAISFLDLMKKALLLAPTDDEREMLAGVYVVTEGNIEAARSLGLETVVVSGKK